jgi:hypothetical protein
MAFKVPDFTKETTTISGGGAYVLDGAESGFRAFVDSLSNGDTTIYTVKGSSGVYASYFGTYTLASDSLSRGILLASSSYPTDITWPDTSVKNVVCGLPGVALLSFLDLLRQALTGGLELVSGSPVPTLSTYALTTFAKTLLDDADAATMRATLSAMARNMSDQTLMAANGDLITRIAGTAVALNIGAVATYLRSNGSLPLWSVILGADLPGSALRGHIDGFTLSRSSATLLNVAAGSAWSEDSARKLLSTTGTETVDLTVSGAGGLGVSRAVDTWYHVFAIYKDADATTDVYADTSPTAANKPAGYSSYRRLGSFRTDATGSGEIINFSQHGDEFLWSVPRLDVDVTNPGTTAVLRALSVPPDVKPVALFTLMIDGAGSAYICYVSSPDVTDSAPTTDLSNLETSNNNREPKTDLRVRANASRQVRTRFDASAAGTSLRLLTHGWNDSRGRNI